MTSCPQPQFSWPMEETLYFIRQTCPLCGPYGSMAFYLCDNQSTVVVQCEECQNIWLDPRNITLGDFQGAQPPDYRIESLGCGVGPGSRWATREEIAQAGYEMLIHEAGPPL